ncbi:MAG: HNH endonuclease domain-containing protein [Bacteroidales bacterium]|nr:HNH endonuclease domain-containing protein [Bacteroidales bacterium]
MIWKELSLLGAWIIDASILRWAELTSKFSKGMLKPSEIIDLLLKDERTRQIDDAKKIYFNHKHELICTWTSSVLSNFEIDHIIPFSLWKNNDLWNLVPTSPKVNREKSDKIVTISLINRAKDNILDNWRFFVKADDKRFFNEAKILTGSYINRSNWENDLFAGLKEAVECTAIQRGIKRWEPKTSTSSQ